MIFDLANNMFQCLIFAYEFSSNMILRFFSGFFCMSLWWIFLCGAWRCLWISELFSDSAKVCIEHLMYGEFAVTLEEGNFTPSAMHIISLVESTFSPNAVTPGVNFRLFSLLIYCGCSVIQSCFFATHGLQHARLPCLSLSPGFAQTHVHWVNNAIPPSHPR